MFFIRQRCLFSVNNLLTLGIISDCWWVFDETKLYSHSKIQVMRQLLLSLSYLGNASLDMNQGRAQIFPGVSGLECKTSVLMSMRALSKCSADSALYIYLDLTQHSCLTWVETTNTTLHQQTNTKRSRVFVSFWCVFIV